MAADELLGRQMPHDLEAEQAVIGSMLIDPRCIGDVCGTVKADDFFSDVNRAVFETIYSMFSYSKTIDLVTVLAQMRENGTATERLGEYLIELMNLTPTSTNVKEYADIVRDKALLRGIATAGSEINTMAMEGFGSAGDILDSSEQKIYALRQGRNTTGLLPVSRVLASVYEQLSTGLPDLDSAIMGLNNSDLILIASRPGMGKTSMALNLALKAAKSSGKSVAVFSLEMSREQLALRLLSSESFIHNKKLQSGMLNAEEWKKLARAASSLSGLKLFINDNPSLTVADMNAQCRRIDDLGPVPTKPGRTSAPCSAICANPAPSNRMRTSSLPCTVRIITTKIPRSAISPSASC